MWSQGDKDTQAELQEMLMIENGATSFKKYQLHSKAIATEGCVP